uniref:Uncharacterized protein n=1 Tax=Siphoviridae sp. ctKcB20 TaxID=2827568 RepID=A0A8S5LLV6_9CAUD|nr:MAG TPA: hypothetical protein [Siphoviridae sp. ctKcB20]
MFHYQLLTGSSYPSPILCCVELDTSFILGLNDVFDKCAELAFVTAL